MIVRTYSLSSSPPFQPHEREDQAKEGDRHLGWGIVIVVRKDESCRPDDQGECRGREQHGGEQNRYPKATRDESGEPAFFSPLAEYYPKYMFACMDSGRPL